MSILTTLILCGLLFLILKNPFQGLVLIVFTVGGFYIFEGRELRRNLDFFEPLLFRCGRSLYVQEGLALIREGLLFKTHAKKMTYLELGLLNANEEYERVRNRLESMAKEELMKSPKLYRELCFAKVKQGELVLNQNSDESYRMRLISCMSLINAHESDKAIEGLLTLREEEAGNVIFKEVNLLLGKLYEAVDEEASTYYQLIADSFEIEKH